jgi:membrane protease YdiL (CAAX protease family)
MLRAMYRSVRGRSVLELSIATVGACVFLAAVPHDTIVNVVLALGALVFVAAQTRDIRARFWRASSTPASVRRRRATWLMTAMTVPIVVCFLIVGRHEGRPLITAALATSLALYLPWAMVQQALFQFYLHGRLRALLPMSSPLAACLATSACYAIVHLPDVRLVLLTACAGALWSYCYQRDRCLAPLAVSHAVLGTTFYAWVQGHDALAVLGRAFGL